MLSLGLRYLNGWAMAAADGACKEKPEWPPHPDRVFMALVAAHFETGGDPAERTALEWLETLPPPALAASEATERQAVNCFVPVNDTSNLFEDEKKWKLAQPTRDLAIYRPRRPRSFPVAIPRDPTVYLLWPGVHLDEHKAILTKLCRKVTHVGHSASFIQMWLEESPPEANWLPDSVFADRRFRIATDGRLAELEWRMNRQACLEHADREARIKESKGKAKKALQTEQAERFPNGAPVFRRPEPGLWQGYARSRSAPVSEVPGSIFDPRAVILSLSGRRPGLRATLRLTAALRGAILSGCPTPVPEWISGHQSSGRPSAQPHLALFPLPFVGSEHADGRVMGLALALPAGVSSEEVGPVLTPWLLDERGLPRTHRLFDGQWLECSVTLEERETPPWNLRPDTWTSPARRWATVTPLALDRHHGGKDRWEQMAETVKDACERIGLPRPLEVALLPVSPVRGVPHANEFVPIRRKQGGGLRHIHAVLLFDRPVRGPVLIGAGRFRGYGLCRPDDLREGFADA